MIDLQYNDRIYLLRKTAGMDFYRDLGKFEYEVEYIKVDGEFRKVFIGYYQQVADWATPFMNRGQINDHSILSIWKHPTKTPRCGDYFHLSDILKDTKEHHINLLDLMIDL